MRTHTAWDRIFHSYLLRLIRGHIRLHRLLCFGQSILSTRTNRKRYRKTRLKTEHLSRTVLFILLALNSLSIRFRFASLCLFFFSLLIQAAHPAESLHCIHVLNIYSYRVGVPNGWCSLSAALGLPGFCVWLIEWVSEWPGFPLLGQSKAQFCLEESYCVVPTGNVENGGRFEDGVWTPVIV